MNGLYLPTSRNNSTDFYDFDSFSSVDLDKKRHDAQNKHMNSDTDINTGSQGTANKEGATTNQTNTTKPDQNSSNNELTPTDQAFGEDIGRYDKKMADEKTSKFMDSVNSNGEWQGFTNTDAVKIFALNNWSMLHWNIGHDEIS
jgi:hypothetical protein